MKLPDALVPLLRCPRCKGHLAPPEPDHVQCGDPGCDRSFPIVSDRPVLIDEERSVFSHCDYRPIAAPSPKQPGPLDRLRSWMRHVPSPSVNLSAVRCFERMRTELLARSSAPIVLVVGSGIMGKGMDALAGDPSILLINVDPSPNSEALVHCDGLDLPLADGCIDGVVIQAVLEHVADPVRCVEEIHRVLRLDGLVYSEIPFMQQVHQQGYDFTRFSHLGHRRLFRRFGEIDSGAVAGPGTALAWSWRYFLAGFARSRLAVRILAGIGRVMAMLVEQADYLLGQRPAAVDGASCTYFFGTKSDRTLSDRELLAGYRGLQR
jgi:SAM-dependent methyltransferase